MPRGKKKVVKKPAPMQSAINPKHYALTVNGQPVEAIDIVESLYPDDVHVATALIYILRAGKKSESSYVADISKAIWWLVRALMFNKVKHIELPEGAPVKGDS